MPVGVALAALVGTMALLGAVNAVIVRMPVFDVGTELDRQFSLPVLVSGGLLLAAAAMTLRCHVLPEAAPRWAWRGWLVLFAYLGVDELVSIHESLESALDVNWQVLYVPLGLFAAAAWFAVFQTLADRLARALWFGGAAFWAVSQAFEAIRWALDTPEEGDAGSLADALTGVEEILEMAGSALFVLAVLAAAGWRWPQRTRQGERV